MRITLLHNKECRDYIKAIEALEEALIYLQKPPIFIIRLIDSDESARRSKFFGSPTIQINGVDIDNDAKKATNFHSDGCRFYNWKGKSYTHPPKEMLVHKLHEH